jgi:hypothetical protein
MSKNQTTSSSNTDDDTNIKSTVHEHKVDTIHSVAQEHTDVLTDDDRLLDFYQWQQVIRSSETTVRRLATDAIEGDR